MAQYSKRGRNNNRRRQGGNNNPNRSMDSQGPEVKIRGTATQIYDKYQALARDAASSGDRIRAESLMQHAEHYYRLMKSMQPEKPAEQRRENNEDAPSQDQQPAAEATVETKTEEGAAVETPADTSTEATSGDGAPEAPAAAAEDNAEEARPRRRRRRRKTADESDAAEASGESQATPEPVAELEEAAAK